MQRVAILSRSSRCFRAIGAALPGDWMRYNVGDALGLCGWRIREASLP